MYKRRVPEADYRDALRAAIAEYERLGDERRRIDDRLAQLAQTIGSLCRLLGLTSTQPFGLTDACRLVFRNAGVPLSPTDVRDRLRAIGMDLAAYSNEMAAIHTVVRRLHDAGEIRAMAVPGKQLYAWHPRTTTYAITPEVADAIRHHGSFHTQRDIGRAKRQKRLKRTSEASEPDERSGALGPPERVWRGDRRDEAPRARK
jgi:hypothetical protein